MGPILLDPGRLTARLDLEIPVDASDGQGGAARTYAPVASLWAQIEAASAVEEERADAAFFSVTHRIWIRFRDDLAAGMRFRRGTRLFNLKAFTDPDETRRYLVCRCVEEGR